MDTNTATSNPSPHDNGSTLRDLIDDLRRMYPTETKREILDRIGPRRDLGPSMDGYNWSAAPRPAQIDLLPFVQSLLRHQRALMRGYDELVRMVDAIGENPLYYQPYRAMSLVGNFKDLMKELTWRQERLLADVEKIGGSR